MIVLDTIFTKTYYPVNDNGNSDVLIYNTNIDIDSNYLLVGLTNIDNNYTILPKYQMQLIKTDTLGNLLWRKTYGDTTYTYYGYKVVPAFGGGYLLGGWCNINGGDNCIIKVDENGENPEFKYFGHSSYDDGRVMGITLTSDSCYILSMAQVIYFDGANEMRKARIVKLDSSLNMIWDKLYLNYGMAAFFWNAYEKYNGNILVHASNHNTQYEQQMVIMELTVNGDSIWKQTTTVLDTTTTDNFMESGKLTPDGGMVFAGWCTSQYLTPYHQQMGLIKTDSLGCDGTQWTSCGTTYIPELVADKEDSGLRVWPNPAKNILFLELNNSVIARKNDEAIPSSKEIATSITPRNDVKVNRHCERSVAIPKSKQIAIPINRDRLSKALAMTFSKEEFALLPIQEKLAYNTKHLEQNLWTEKEEQEMRELSHKLAYAFPFEVIKGKVDIFSIDPALKATVIARSTVIARKNDEAIPKNNKIASSYRPCNDVQKVTIYDIFGRIVKQTVIAREVWQSHQTDSHGQSPRYDAISINISNLQSGVYIIKVGNQVAKFIKE